VRPYKAAWPSERAFEYIDEQRGRHFDPRLAAAFMSAKTQILQIQSEWSDRSSQR
jgi:putative two-component system response regulator